MCGGVCIGILALFLEAEMLQSLHEQVRAGYKDVGKEQWWWGGGGVRQHGLNAADLANNSK